MRSTVCPHPRSLHTGYSPEQRSRFDSYSLRHLLARTAKWRLKNSFSNLHAVEISKLGAVGKLVKPSIFQVDACGFNSRRHCQIQHGSARLSAWATVCKTAASCVAGSTPARPTKSMESKSIGRSALFAKQMDEQLWFESTALRL